VHLDYETYSEADIKTVGLARYARDKSTRIILAAWTDERGNLKQYDERNPKSNTLDELRSDLLEAKTIHAWNAGFEQELTEHVLGLNLPDEKWSCTMGHAQYRSLPASLDEACHALGIEGKTSESSRLIRIFCMPPKPVSPKEQPGDWQRFVEYNQNDIVIEAAVATYLDEIGLGWPEEELRVYQMSQRINRRGVPVDAERARIASRVFDRLCADALREIQQITGIENPNSPIQIKQWVQRKLGVQLDSLDAATINGLLSKELPQDVRRVLLLRVGAGMSAPKKYDVAVRQTVDGVMRHMLQYSGAGRTHRWSGRGLQPQNLRRGLGSDEEIQTAWDVLQHEDVDLLRSLYPAPFKLVADLVRSIVRDPGGRKLAIADFASIEVVMLYWAAGDEEKMKRFAEGLDPYKDFAAAQFGVKYEEVTKEQRTFAKPPVLGGGYGLGAKTLIEYAAGMGVKMTPEEAQRAIRTYRDTHPLIVALWDGLETAMKQCIIHRKPYRYREFVFAPRDHHVVCQLPAGTEITYINARVVEMRRMRVPPADVESSAEKLKAWKEDPDNWYWSDVIQYDGVNQHTGQWGEINTWGGKLTENVVQSISRDVLARALREAERRGLDVVLHVHDEIVVLAREGSEEADLRELQECMTAPDWCRNAPIRSAGFLAPAYRKD
jgi:DNA polymerase